MQEIVFKIEKQVWGTVHNDNRIGVLNGLSGIALFYNCLVQIYNNEEYQEKLIVIIEKINDIISQDTCLPTFCSGLAGYGWTLLKISKKIIDIDESYFYSLDRILAQELSQYAIEDDYDFLHGSTGIAMYFIDRYKYSKDDFIKKVLFDFSNDLINKITTNLEVVLIRKDSADDCNYIYFGLAHGVAGLINFLVYLQTNFREPIDSLGESIRICIDYLKKFEDINKESNQSYPNHFLIENRTFAKSRLAWCQGDLGIGNSLYNAGLLLDDIKLKEEGIKLIKATQKITLNDSGVKDFGICHGSTGILLQYFLASTKNENSYEDVISKWFEVLKKQTVDFSRFLAMDNRGYLNETNVLEGSAGLGLVILTLDNKIKLDWLSCLNLH